MSRFFTPMFRDPFFTNTFYQPSFSNMLDPTSILDDSLLLTNSNTSQTDNSNEGSVAVRQARRAPRHHHHPLSLFAPVTSVLTSPTMPDMAVDMMSSPTEYTVHASLPGINKKDINITVEDRVLNIAAERRQQHKESRSLALENNQKSITSGKSGNQQELKHDEQKASPAETSTKNSTAAMTDDDKNTPTYEYIESTFGRVERSITLPEDAMLDSLQAKYEDGVIKISIPRIQEKKPQKQRITVQ